MANKLFTTLSILAATFLAAGVQAQDPSCPPNSSLCGHALLNTFNCTSLPYLLPRTTQTLQFTYLQKVGINLRCN